jgi:CMP-N-acetylneuraminic acid synthetase
MISSSLSYSAGLFIALTIKANKKSNTCILVNVSLPVLAKRDIHTATDCLQLNHQQFLYSLTALASTIGFLKTARTYSQWNEYVLDK